MIKIVLVGGGSVHWSPRLINDLLLTPSLSLQSAEYVIYDLNQEAGLKMADFGNKLARHRGLSCSFHATVEASEALTDAHYVLITISTGDLDAMEYDLLIPDDYRIYQTVGDTVGPGGWARSLRNIPVFVELARSIERYSKNAVVLNYTNPMATLTKTFYQVSNLRTVGLCHGLFEVYAVLMRIFGLESENEIKVRFGGTNHFFWMLDMQIRGEDGYALLKERLNGRSFAEVVKELYDDEAGYNPDKLVSNELFQTYGYLPYVGDTHTSEFLPYYLTQDPSRLANYKLKRKTIEGRRMQRQKYTQRLDVYLSDIETVTTERSRESAADIIAAFESKQDFIDVMNLPNKGQIANLPKDSIVETLGVVNSLGFTPLTVGNLPEPLLNLVLPHVRNQDLIVEAALEGDRDKALYALYSDPLCSHLSYPEVKEMGEKLLKAHNRFMPEGIRL
ncbi:family 4 glycosyl hydrolase [Paenibacillus cremeus]|uniref:Glycosyl hydrolase family 4 C-terminal domain-containing protein n=1 Tax=Paenibacillus cremeus TaxID=2163881 RepID=A0A559K0W5_9BACL|nr:hypothetical protein [Paenibacillus cremeus]TVY05690.1 hypothetical protein FPZ49_28880 [Paenibacillus cremeus]